MDYNNLKQLFETNQKLHLKLYSLEYNIEVVDNKVVIYAIYYEKNKKYFNSFDELINYYTVYNEPLINQLNRIKVLD